MAVYSIKYLFFTIECQMNRFFACLYLAVLVSACAECEVIPGVKTAFYGVTQGGDTVTQYILTNASGAQFKVID